MLKIKKSSKFQMDTSPKYALSGQRSNTITSPIKQAVEQRKPICLRGFLKGMDTTFIREDDRV